jgi:hypothetical protein
MTDVSSCAAESSLCVCMAWLGESEEDACSNSNVTLTHFDAGTLFFFFFLGGSGMRFSQNVCVCDSLFAGGLGRHGCASTAVKVASPWYLRSFRIQE